MHSPMRPLYIVENQSLIIGIIYDCNRLWALFRVSFFLLIPNLARAVTYYTLPLVCYNMHALGGCYIRFTPHPHSYAVGLAVYSLVIYYGSFFVGWLGSAVIRGMLSASVVAPFQPRNYLFVQYVGRRVYSLCSGVLYTLVFQLRYIRLIGICNFF